LLGCIVIKIYIMIDISRSNIQKAKEIVSGPRFVEADKRKIMLPPESVDLVIAHMLFEFLDPEEL
jgi:Methyltransferase domain